MENKTLSYYLSNRTRILGEVGAILQSFQQLISTTFPAPEAGQIADETLRRFETLLPDLPYIGGNQNLLTQNLITGALFLCIYKALKARGINVEAIGEMVYETVKAVSFAKRQASPPGKEEVEQIIALRERAAEFSQANPFLYGWLTAFLEGDGSGFDWGVDYTTCGICKLFEEHAAFEFVPYLCFLDLPMYQARGIGLVRTSTLAQGGKKCDFRFNLHGEFSLEWVPEFYAKRIK